MPYRPSRSSLAPRVLALVIVIALAGAGAWLWLSRGNSKSADAGAPVSLITLAGDGQRGSADGPGAAARFSDPFAIAIDAKGALYVADAGETGRVRKIEPDGATTTLPGVFDTPSGLAIDNTGNVYVADTAANRISRITPAGVVTILAGDGTAGSRDGPAAQAQFNGPMGLAIDKAGALYVADTYNDRIRLITPQGEVSTLAGGAPGFADGQGAGAAFDRPCGLAFDAADALLVADTGNEAIRRIDKAGVVSTLTRRTAQPPAAALREPIGLASAADGSIYIAAYARGRILQLSPNGELRVLAGPDAAYPENRDLRLTRPAGLAIDRKGALYVAEAGGYAIRKLTPRRRGEAQAPQPRQVLPALLSAASVPWPLAPQDSWHEVVGNMGEVRGSDSGESRDHLHAGLDIRADVGETVLASADEKVADPLSTWNFGGISEGLQIDQLIYIHMRVGRTPAGEPLDPARFHFLRDPAGKLTSVRVKRGTRFHVGDPLGTVNQMAHVHLELGARGESANPIGLRLPGLTDHFIPRIARIQVLDTAGMPFAGHANGRLIVPHQPGPYSIAVDAWDQVDGDAPRRRLGLYRAGYQILKADGTPVAGFEQPLIAIEFDRLPLDRAAARIAYAPDSGETVHGASETHFVYVVSNRVQGGRAESVGWNPTNLPPGDYTIRILAADYAGNTALEGRDLPITLR